MREMRNHYLTKIPKGVRYLIVILFSIGLTACGFVLHPFAPIGILLGVWLFFLSIRSPFILLILFVIFLTARFANLFPVLGAMRAGKLLAIAAIAVFLISKLTQKDLSIVRSPFNRWFIVFSAAILLSSFFGTWPSASLNYFFNYFTKVIIIFFLIINVVLNVRQAVAFQVCLAVNCAFVGGYALLSQILGRDPISGAALVEGSRAASAGLDPNDTAILILMTTPFLLLAAIKSKLKQKIPFAIMCFLAIAGIISTQSRGGLLGLTAGIALVINRYVKNKLLFVSVIAGILVVLIMIANISERASGGAAEEGIDQSAQSRFDAWNAGYRMMTSHPLTGVGFNQFSANFLNYAVNPVSQEHFNAHNSFIQVASELGICGFIPFLMILYIALKTGLTMARGAKDTHDLQDIVRLSAFPCLVSVLVAAFFLSQGYYASNYVLLAFIAACGRIFNSVERS